VSRPLPGGLLVLGVGGNVGGADALVARFRRVAEAFAPWGRVRASSVIRTAPWGGPAQAPFLNAALTVAPAEAPSPAELMATVHEVERLLGRDRDRETRWGPRPLDLDVLLWGPAPLVWAGPPALEVPHPRLALRRFALVPVIELVGEDVVLPGDGRTLGAIEAAIARTADQQVDATDLVVAGQFALQSM
jgi:2-amino-4-hydroxy-6-hydroxymethyldihydropteridine diphosphokinase